jgi:hypothetical protein
MEDLATGSGDEVELIIFWDVDDSQLSQGDS